ncbi:MAG: DUF4881 domain-containing protein, partial [Desulfovibrio sp.]|nr:DUF4881 domain-containing protein [Desulfovibrio sp.]
MKIRTLLLTLGMLGSIALLAGCDLKGGVEQGRCVAFEKGKSVTIVAESLDANKKSTYSETAKVLTFKLPVAARDMGPTPETGCLLAADPDKGFVLVYDKAAMKVAKLAVNFTDVEKNVDAKHP